MANTPTLSFRVRADLHSIVRDLARGMTRRPDIVDAVRLLIAEADTPTGPTLPTMRHLVQRIEAVETWQARYEAAHVPTLHTAHTLQALQAVQTDACDAAHDTAGSVCSADRPRAGRIRHMPTADRPRGRHLTAAEREAVNAKMDPLISDGETTNAEIMRMTGVGEHTVTGRRKELGKPAPRGGRPQTTEAGDFTGPWMTGNGRGKRFLPDGRADVMRRLAAGEGISAIARLVGAGWNAVDKLATHDRR